MSSFPALQIDLVTALLAILRGAPATLNKLTKDSAPPSFRDDVCKLGELIPFDGRLSAAPLTSHESNNFTIFEVFQACGLSSHDTIRDTRVTPPLRAVLLLCVALSVDYSASEISEFLRQLSLSGCRRKPFDLRSFSSFIKATREVRETLKDPQLQGLIRLLPQARRVTSFHGSQTAIPDRQIGDMLLLIEPMLEIFKALKHEASGMQLRLKGSSEAHALARAIYYLCRDNVEILSVHGRVLLESTNCPARVSIRLLREQQPQLIGEWKWHTWQRFDPTNVRGLIDCHPSSDLRFEDPRPTQSIVSVQSSMSQAQRLNLGHLVRALVQYAMRHGKILPSSSRKTALCDLKFDEITTAPFDDMIPNLPWFLGLPALGPNAAVEKALTDLITAHRNHLGKNLRHHFAEALQERLGSEWLPTSTAKMGKHAAVSFAFALAEFCLLHATHHGIRSLHLPEKIHKQDFSTREFPVLQGLLGENGVQGSLFLDCAILVIRGYPIERGYGRAAQEHWVACSYEGRVAFPRVLSHAELECPADAFAVEVQHGRLLWQETQEVSWVREMDKTKTVKEDDSPFKIDIDDFLDHPMGRPPEIPKCLERCKKPRLFEGWLMFYHASMSGHGHCGLQMTWNDPKQTGESASLMSALVNWALTPIASPQAESSTLEKSSRDLGPTYDALRTIYQTGPPGRIYCRRSGSPSVSPSFVSHLNAVHASHQRTTSPPPPPPKGRLPSPTIADFRNAGPSTAPATPPSAGQPRQRSPLGHGFTKAYPSPEPSPTITDGVHRRPHPGNVIRRDNTLVGASGTGNKNGAIWACGANHYDSLLRYGTADAENLCLIRQGKADLRDAVLYAAQNAKGPWLVMMDSHTRLEQWDN